MNMGYGSELPVRFVLFKRLLTKATDDAKAVTSLLELFRQEIFISQIFTSARLLAALPEQKVAECGIFIPRIYSYWNDQGKIVAVQIQDRIGNGSTLPIDDYIRRQIAPPAETLPDKSSCLE